MRRIAAIATGGLLALLLSGAGFGFGVAPADAKLLHKGDVIVTFSGTGHGAYRYGSPEFDDAAGACEDPPTSYTLSYSYHWRFSDYYSATGGFLGYAASGGGSARSYSPNTSIWSAHCLQNLPVVAPTTCKVPFQPPDADGGWPRGALEIRKRTTTAEVLSGTGLDLSTTHLSSACASGTGGGTQFTMNPDELVNNRLTAQITFRTSRLKHRDAVSRKVRAAVKASCSSTSCQYSDACRDTHVPTTGPVYTCILNDSYSAVISVRAYR
jgi:hypothetical protein